MGSKAKKLFIIFGYLTLILVVAVDLAALGLLAVATWLGKVGKNNKMFLFHMAFMLIVTMTSLFFTLKSNFEGILAGGAGLTWSVIRVVISALLMVLAVILTVDGIKTLKNQRNQKNQKNQKKSVA